MKNKTALEQMYYGERGQYDSVRASTEYSRLVEIASNLEKEFLEKLNNNKELIKLHKKIIDAYEDASCEEVKNNYFEGFKFGLLMGIDVTRSE